MRKKFDLAGQWVGFGNGNPSGDVVVDLDPVGAEAVGLGYLFVAQNANGSLPCSAVNIKVKRYLQEQKFAATVFHFDARIGYVLSDSEARNAFPDAALPKSANVTIKFNSGSEISINWETEIGTHGSSILKKDPTEPDAGPHLLEDVGSWDAFKAFVSRQSPNEMIYRGQARPYPLQTSFHRTARKDLPRYLKEDVPALHRALSARTRHFFDLNQPQQLGAFLNLAQHHGFPTPLLDWSYSPYVAAYFAYSGVASPKKTDKVRMFVLNKSALIENSPQFQHLTFTYPQVSILEALSIENDRAIPQQGLLTVTNMSRIELYLRIMEQRSGVQILRVIDLPASEAKNALSELRLMGITKSSLFPSIESICLDTKERRFG